MDSLSPAIAMTMANGLCAVLPSGAIRCGTGSDPEAAAESVYDPFALFETRPVAVF